MSERDRVNRRRYLTVDDAGNDVLDGIERLQSSRIQRRLDSRIEGVRGFTHPSAKTRAALPP